MSVGHESEQGELSRPGATTPQVRLVHLQSFLAVAEYLHFGRAAESLHLAQPVLSRHISALERSLACRLFDRTTRLVTLTEAGRVLVGEANLILAQVGRTVERVRQSDAGYAGVLHVGMVASAALSVIPKVSLALTDGLGPAVDLNYADLVTDAQIDALRRGTIDIGFIRETDRADGLDVRLLVKEPLIAAVPRSHRLANSAEISLIELEGEKFITSPRAVVPRLYDHLSALCHTAGFRFQVAHEALQFTTILGLVSAGAGVAIVPGALVSLNLPDLAYLSIADENAYSAISYAHRISSSVPPLVSRSVELLDQIAESLKP